MELLDFESCLKILEDEAEYTREFQGCGQFFRGDEDYDDDGDEGGYYEEDYGPRPGRFKREVNVSAYIEGLKMRVACTKAAEELLTEKASQLKKLVLAFEYQAPSLTAQVARDNEQASRHNLEACPETSKKALKCETLALKAQQRTIADLATRYFLPVHGYAAQSPEDGWFLKPSAFLGLNPATNASMPQPSSHHQ